MDGFYHFVLEYGLQERKQESKKERKKESNKERNYTLIHLIALLLFHIVIFLICDLNIYLWLLTPISAIYITIITNRILAKTPLKNFFIWLGGISAYLFAIHPLIRILFYRYANTPEPYITSFIYLAISIVAAITYKKCFELFYKFIKTK